MQADVRDRQVAQFQKLDVGKLAEELQSQIRRPGVAKTKFVESLEAAQVPQPNVGHRASAQVDPGEIRDFAEPFQSRIAELSLRQGKVNVGEFCERLQFTGAFIR